MTNPGTLLADYGAYHRDWRNLICHEIGIPLIVLGVIALLRLVTLTGSAFSLASLVVVVVMVYYAAAFGREARAATYIAIVGLAVLYVIAVFVTWPFAIAAFVVGWVFQFVGHAYEGKSPAFLTNLLHLLVGPLWVASHLVPKSASSSSAP
ncbi:MAG: hypothetical protein JWM87_4287 [Candidatus Eremiobacteraeota bacterium]|nr:hypothetical protein [Candidatus Eremiobacteraeota bacterium]